MGRPQIGSGACPLGFLTSYCNPVIGGKDTKKNRGMYRWLSRSRQLGGLVLPSQTSMGPHVQERAYLFRMKASCVYQVNLENRGHLMPPDKKQMCLYFRGFVTG